MIGIIYKYESPSKKVYIGQTFNIKQRKLDFDHFDGRYAGTKFNRAIKKYGPEGFKYEVLIKISCKTKEELRAKLDELEIYYINKYDSYKNGYNMTLGGSGSKGCFQTEESRAIISSKAKGRKGSFLGRKHTEETKKLLSDNAKKRVGDKNPFYGKHHSDTTKKAIAKANSKEVVQIDKNTNKIIAEFSSAVEAALSFGKKAKANSEIIKVCKGYVSPSGKHYITAFGYKWKYKESSTTIS